MITDVHEGQVDVDGYMFNLKSPDSDWLSDQVSEMDDETHLAALDGFVTVTTDCQFGDVPVRIELHDGPPAALEPRWQHAVEVSLTTNGALEVRSWTDEEPAFTVAVPPGWIRLRALWTGLTFPIHWDEYGGNFSEAMTFQIWQATPSERLVVRWWPAWHLPERSPISSDGRRQVEGLELIRPRLAELRRLPMVIGITGPDLPFPGDSADAADLVHAHRIPGGSLLDVRADVTDGTWWAHGYSARLTLREITEEELQAVMASCSVYAWRLYRLRRQPGRGLLEIPIDVEPPVTADDARLVSADQRWLEMLKRVNYPTTITEL